MSRSAEKLRSRMARTKAGWTPSDLDRLYRGFGFDVREGSGHRIYAHPAHRHLRATVRRSSPLPPGYIETALELLRALDVLAGNESGDEP